MLIHSWALLIRWRSIWLKYCAYDQKDCRRLPRKPSCEVHHSRLLVFILRTHFLRILSWDLPASLEKLETGTLSGGALSRSVSASQRHHPRFYYVNIDFHLLVSVFFNFFRVASTLCVTHDHWRSTDAAYFFVTSFCSFCGNILWLNYLDAILVLVWLVLQCLPSIGHLDPHDFCSYKLFRPLWMDRGAIFLLLFVWPLFGLRFPTEEDLPLIYVSRVRFLLDLFSGAILALDFWRTWLHYLSLKSRLCTFLSWVECGS